jgi:hypothetical protein
MDSSREEFTTRLADAVRRGMLAEVKDCIACGANLDATPSGASSPALHMAVDQQACDMIHVLLAGGADPHVRDSNGDTALHRAVDLGDAAVVEALLSTPRADVNIRDSSGTTPLMIAAARHPAIVALLLQHGADATATDVHGSTALDHAQGVAQQASISLLRTALSPMRPSTVSLQTPRISQNDSWRTSHQTTDTDSDNDSIESTDDRLSVSAGLSSSKASSTVQDAIRSGAAPEIGSASTGFDQPPPLRPRGILQVAQVALAVAAHHVNDVCRGDTGCAGGIAG